MHDQNILQQRNKAGKSLFKNQTINCIVGFCPNSFQEKSAIGCGYISCWRRSVDVR